jgi:dipeptidyl aminopeptidase/acylaminoacyl peptidase
MSTSADGRKVLVLAASASDPGAYYRVDLDTRDIREIGKVAPWLQPKDLAQVTALRVKSGDGTEFDAFLAAPPGVARPPIVVLPHGGPIGVMDGREFSREVQFLAERGMAVLQVNYRGSEGYGKSFLEAGKREWGRGIEDDIDAALAQVIARGAVDEQRMCLAGGSYGGYSALIGVLRHPDRFRCAASFAGVTDIPLMFASSDWSVSPLARKTMAEVVGDPATEYETLKGLSPVYQVDKLRVPVFIAQGSHDVRVHPDHAYRMKAMLELGGKEFEWLMVEDMGHGFDSLEQECAYFKRLRNFLTRRLELPPN